MWTVLDIILIVRSTKRFNTPISFLSCKSIGSTSIPKESNIVSKMESAEYIPA